MFRWITGRGATPRQVERTYARISPELWRKTLAAHRFLDGLSEPERDALRQRSAWLLASKTFTGVQGLEPTDDIMLSIAVQAALPILALDTKLYDGWHEIVLYPGGFVIPRMETDDSGVVHEYLQEASGEAWDGGPVILSWEDAGPGGEFPDNVVIHEFAHKLDLHTGDADGMPSLAGRPELSPRRWRAVLEQAFTDFCDALEAVEAAIPADVDPESDAAASWYGTLPLDPYAATDEAEFFAVSSEAFFVDPEPLAHALPDWYGLLATYYRQDPLERRHTLA
jgi:Mlc titration factor MtfA (ptsG expression regulator)